MVDDFDNTDEIENLTDDELRTLVREQLASNNSIDANDIAVVVSEGAVTLTGRVGTEEEVRIADHLLTDVIGLSLVNNELVVDELRRAESPEAADEHIADEEKHSGLLLGEVSGPFSPESEHLADMSRDDSEGTHDVREATEGGRPWIPPESPTPEGMSGQDQDDIGL